MRLRRSCDKDEVRGQPHTRNHDPTVYGYRRRVGVVTRVKTGEPSGRPNRVWSNPRIIGRGFTPSHTGAWPMYKPTSPYIYAAVLAVVGLSGRDAFAAELDGAIQYPPPSAGEDAQPPSPARMVPQPVSQWRIELGVSGSSVVPTTPRFYLLSPPSLDKPGKPPSSEAGGNAPPPYGARNGSRWAVCLGLCSGSCPASVRGLSRRMLRAQLVWRRPKLPRSWRRV